MIKPWFSRQSTGSASARELRLQLNPRPQGHCDQPPTCVALAAAGFLIGSSHVAARRGYFLVRSRSGTGY